MRWWQQAGGCTRHFYERDSNCIDPPHKLLSEPSSGQLLYCLFFLGGGVAVQFSTFTKQLRAQSVTAGLPQEQQCQNGHPWELRQLPGSPQKKGTAREVVGFTMGSSTPISACYLPSRLSLTAAQQRLWGTEAEEPSAVPQTHFMACL